MPRNKLTAKQTLFCKEYLIDKNATQAAIRAGYSKKTAQRIATENLSKLVIRNRIEKELSLQHTRIEVTADKIIQEICKLAFIDPSKLFDDKGNLIAIHELPKGISACIASIEVEHPVTRPGTVVKKIRLWDKKGALELLAKHFNLLAEDRKDKDGDTYIMHIINSFNGNGHKNLNDEDKNRISELREVLSEGLTK